MISQDQMDDLEHAACCAGVSADNFGEDDPRLKSEWWATVEIGDGTSEMVGPFDTREDALRGGMAEAKELPSILISFKS